MLNEGDIAPAFHLLADDGHKLSLADLRGKHVALYFYPKASTPGCTTEAIEFRELKNKFDKLNTVVLGCSADSVSMGGFMRSIAPRAVGISFRSTAKRTTKCTSCAILKIPLIVISCA